MLISLCFHSQMQNTSSQSKAQGHCDLNSDSLNKCKQSSDYTNNTLNAKQELHRRNICDDAVKIYQKYLAKDAVNSIAISETTRGHIVDCICVNTSLIQSDCFMQAQIEVREIIEKE